MFKLVNKTISVWGDLEDVSWVKELHKTKINDNTGASGFFQFWLKFAKILGISGYKKELKRAKQIMLEKE